MGGDALVVSSPPARSRGPAQRVQVSRGRIVGQGVNDSIDANGNARTVGCGEGISVVSQGRVSGSTGLPARTCVERLHRHLDRAHGVTYFNRRMVVRAKFFASGTMT